MPKLYQIFTGDILTEQEYKEMLRKGRNYLIIIMSSCVVALFVLLLFAKII